MEKQYFATLPIDKIGEALQKKVDGYYEYIRNSGLFDLWNYQYYQWQKAMTHKGRIVKSGNSLEYDLLFVNHFRTIGERVVNNITAQRPTFKCKAGNTDATTQQQAKMGNAILEHYYRENGFETVAREAAKLSMFLSEGYIYRPWNAKLGKIIGYKPLNKDYIHKEQDEEGNEIETPDDGETTYQFEGDPDTENFYPVHEGDIEFQALETMDVIRDWTAWKFSDCNWLIVRTWKNKFALAKEYPEFAEKIIAIIPNYGNRAIRNMENKSESDYIPLYEFYHIDCDLVPGGLYIPFLNAETILMSSALPYKEIPLDRMVESEVRNRPFGYSRASDAVPIQTAYDRINSTVFSNQSTLGGQSFAVQEGSNPQYEQLSEGLNVITYGQGFEPPQILQKLQTPPELFTSIEKKYQEMLNIFGTNETAQGNPSADVATAKGQMLMNQLDIQNATSIQNAYVRMLEKSATGVLKTAQVYADAPRFAKIIGKNQEYMLKEWNKASISDIDTVIVELGSPIQRTPGYVMEIAETMLKYGVQVDPNKLFQSLQYNNLDFMTATFDNTEILIASENEKLMLGETCVVSPYDKHDQHIQEHNEELNNPENRNNPQAIQTLVAHIMEHWTKWQQADPGLLVALGIPPFPAPPELPPPPIDSVPHVIKRTTYEGDEPKPQASITKTTTVE